MQSAISNFTTKNSKISTGLTLKNFSAKRDSGLSRFALDSVISPWTSMVRPTDGLNSVGVHEFDKLVNTSVLISWIIHASRIASRAPTWQKNTDLQIYHPTDRGRSAEWLKGSDLYLSVNILNDRPQADNWRPQGLWANLGIPTPRGNKRTQTSTHYDPCTPPRPKRFYSSHCCSQF